ncbi:MAG: DNA alkylation repair protein [Bacteroidota bacterium]
MAEPLKNRYSESFLQGFTVHMKEVYPSFAAQDFLQQVLGKQWPDLELKERMRHIANCLRQHLPQDLATAFKLLQKLALQLRGEVEESMSFEYLFLPDFVQQYGIDDYELSVVAMEDITQYSSCEFAVRPFLLKYEDAMLAQMLQWTDHQNAMVRRLASEGSRPRLPWGLGVPNLKKNPALTLAILENLHEDSSETVRRSVANHLNDMAKDHPEVVLDTVERWQGKSAITDRLIKHACRTLLKQSHPRALALFSLGGAESIKIINFQILTPVVRVGEALAFRFELAHSQNRPLLIRLEYAMYFRKANGSLSKKVFKISEKEYAPQARVHIERKQSFKPITTRKYYAGLHQVAIIANGRAFAAHDFTLKTQAL